MGAVCCNDDSGAKTIETTNTVPDENTPRFTVDAAPAAGQAAAADNKNVPVVETSQERKIQEVAKKETEEVAEIVKKPPEKTTAPVTCEFKINLEKQFPNAKLGCTLSQWKDGNQVAIGTPMGTFLEEWNKTNPTKKVLPGDEVISVCGISGDAKAMLDTLGSNRVLDIVLRRQLQFTVQITKKGPLGLGFELSDGKIIDITEGTFKDYVKKAPPNVSVYIGDQLCGVNDIMSSNNLLAEIQKCKDGERINFHFMRPAVE